MRNRPVLDLSAEDRARAEAMVLAMDAAILVLNKPAGLACQTRDPGDDSLDRLLWAFARSNGKRPHLVHRLDRDTSGVILAARTKPAAAALHAAFEARSVRKTYLAIVGALAPLPEHGVVDVPLTDRRSGALVYSAAVAPGTPGARPAETRWRRLGQSGEAALLEVLPRTGRMHQIRAHLAHAGWPILGDPIYGAGGEALPVAVANRTMLHAFGLDFPDPNDGANAARRRVSAPVPDDFEAAARALGLEGGLAAIREAR